MQLQYTILYGMQRIQGERTGSSMYHLLTGKRSSQTLQDGHMYGLSFLFGTYKGMSRQEYDEQIQVLLTDSRLKQIQENTYVVTEKGENWLQQARHLQFPPHLDGLQYGEAGEVLWKRLSLIMQTVSHLQRKERSFLPIVTDYDVTSWVRQFLLQTPWPRSELAGQLFAECHGLLSQLPEAEAALFVARLSGAERIGYTVEQLAEQYGTDRLRIHFLFLHVLHFLVKTTAAADTYPLLRMIAAYKGRQLAAMSASTERTYRLWQEGKTMDEIVRIRRLKRSTIEDHIIEIALNSPDFPMEQFLPPQKAAVLQGLMKELNTRKLRVLKEHAGADYTYFEIRLALAAWGGAYEA